MTEERVPKEAGVQLEVTTGSSMGGTGGAHVRAFTDVKAAQDGLLSLAGTSAAAAAAGYASYARVQTMTGQVRPCQAFSACNSLDASRICQREFFGLGRPECSARNR